MSEIPSGTVDVANLDYLSLTTTSVKNLCNGKEMGQGSGFFFRHDTNLFLVTNWHVLSGCDSFTGQPLHSSCFTPDEIKIAIYKDMGNYRAQWDVNLKLNNEDGSCKWLEHGVLGKRVDIAVLKLNLQPTFGPRTFVDKDFIERDMAVFPGSDVFVLGYPNGLTKQRNLPVWKRASIASEPELDTDLGPTILIDSTTKKGMSGAPVYAVSRGTYLNQSKETMIGHNAKLLGVYSGRIGVDNIDSAQLGLCWKASSMLEIIENGKSADLIANTQT